MKTNSENKKAGPARTPAYAIVADASRRGGCRVIRVTVVELFPVLSAAMVEQPSAWRRLIGDGSGRGDVAHVLPYAQLSQSRRGLGPKLRAFLGTLSRSPIAAASCASQKNDSRGGDLAADADAADSDGSSFDNAQPVTAAQHAAAAMEAAA